MSRSALHARIQSLAKRSTSCANRMRTRSKIFLAKTNPYLLTPEPLLPMAQCPNLEWDVYHSGAHDINRGLPDDMMAKLDKALDLGPGKLPAEENERWRNFLDVGESNIPAKSNTIPKPSSKASKTSGTHNTTNQASPASPTRPSRRGTKRSYHDQSFEGYGEGYLDDIADAGAYDEGDNGQTGSAAKKRRKRVSSAVSENAQSASPASPSSIPIASGKHQSPGRPRITLRMGGTGQKRGGKK